MSPEVLSGDHYNCSTDVYSFGLIMYYIWTGILPFSELQLNTVQLMFKKNQGVLQLANIDDFNELNGLIQQCVLYQSADRPNTHTIITKLLYISEQL
jgi:serine/threonine protein kinase